MSDTNQRIEITVSSEGAVSIKTTGFTGSSCRDATKAIEEAMGVASKEAPAAGVPPAARPAAPAFAG